MSIHVFSHFSLKYGTLFTMLSYYFTYYSVNQQIEFYIHYPQAQSYIYSEVISLQSVELLKTIIEKQTAAYITSWQNVSLSDIIREAKRFHITACQMLSLMTRWRGTYDDMF
jgi:hypothetical protein